MKNAILVVRNILSSSSLSLSSSSSSSSNKKKTRRNTNHTRGDNNNDNNNNNAKKEKKKKKKKGYCWGGCVNNNAAAAGTVTMNGGTSHNGGGGSGGEEEDVVVTAAAAAAAATTSSSSTSAPSSSSSSSNAVSSSPAPATSSAMSSPSPSPESLLPRYLYPLVRHYHDDFYVSRSFDPRLIVQLMAEGFLPIATRGYLLPKLHVERCVVRLRSKKGEEEGGKEGEGHPPRSSSSSSSSEGSELHVSRSARKKSRRFLLSVNECFDRVVEGCHRQHGTNWLYPPIVAAFRAIHEHTTGGTGVDAMIMEDLVDPPSSSSSSSSSSSFRRRPRPPPQQQQRPVDVTPVRLYSVEVWNAETGALAGGELGYSVGGIYSSLTGFSDEDAAGSSQLVALGRLLMKCGFEYWDLGMDLEYKRKLGARMMRRANFVAEVRRSRTENRGVVLRCGDGEGVRKNARELVDWESPPPPPVVAAAKTTSATTNGVEEERREEKRQPPLATSPSSSEKAAGSRKRPPERDENGGMSDG